jgi:dihydropteroate synthase
MMHMRGNPQTMQTLTNYEDIVKKCCFIFLKKWLWQEVWNNDLIIDPGFGFAKTIAQNYEIFSKWNCLICLNFHFLLSIQKIHDL